VGDAFGNRVTWWLERRPVHLPPGPWAWSDDTHMALSILEVALSAGAVPIEWIGRREMLPR
jgi:hypothetical protein